MLLVMLNEMQKKTFIIFMIIVNTSFYFGRGVLSKYAFNISSGYIILLTVYNTARMIIEHSHGIPFDSDKDLDRILDILNSNLYNTYILPMFIIKDIEKDLNYGI